MFNSTNKCLTFEYLCSYYFKPKPRTQNVKPACNFSKTRAFELCRKGRGEVKKSGKFKLNNWCLKKMIFCSRVFEVLFGVL